MTQFQHTLRQLLLGEKTETSRIVKPEHNLIDGAVCTTQVYGFYAMDGMGQRGYFNGHHDRQIYAVGKDYAIQPHRNAKSVGRYRIEAIWRQDVRTLTETQIHAEGFQTWQDFYRVWCEMHDRKALPFPTDLTIWRHLAERPDDRYVAWRMTIRVLWDTIDWDAPAVRALQIEPKSVY